MYVALVTQHAKGMCRIILSSAACLAVPYFFHMSGMIYGEKLLNTKCVF